MLPVFFLFLAFLLFGSFLGFLPFFLYCPSVFECHLIYSWEPLAFFWGGGSPLIINPSMSGFDACFVSSNCVFGLLVCPLSFSFLKKILFIFREKGREGETGEKHQCVVASLTPPTGDLAGNPGMCPDLEIKPATLWFAGQRSIH